MLNHLQDLCNEILLLFLSPKGEKALKNTSDLSGYSPIHLKLKLTIITLLSYNIMIKNTFIH